MKIVSSLSMGARLVALGFVFVFFVAGVGCDDNKVVQGDLSVLLIGRDYLDSEYMETLSKTRSPYRTNQQSKGYDRVRIKRDVGGNYVFELGTFDGVYAVLVFDSFGKQLSLDGKPLKPVVLSLKVDGPNDFTVEFNEKVRTFRLVRDVDQFVIRHTVVGIYSDSHGKRYEFTEQGHAVFPDRSFRFVVDAGSAFTRFDTVIETELTGEGIRWYGFEYVAGTLKLYRVSGNMNEKKESQPFLVLTEENAK